MHIVNVRQLKSNPSTALRDARTEMVAVMNRNKPDAVLIGFEQLEGMLDLAHVRQAMAVNLFKYKLISVGSAAKMAGKSLGEMLTDAEMAYVAMRFPRWPECCVEGHRHTIHATQRHVLCVCVRLSVRLTVGVQLDPEIP